MKKKLLCLILSALMLLPLYSCGNSDSTESEDSMKEGPSTTTSPTPETDPPKDDGTSVQIEVGNGKKIMTFVMGRERTAAYSGSYNTWQNNGHMPDKTTEEGLRDISSVLYPSIGLYDVTDPDYQEYMMQLCRLCYIDTVNYYFSTPDDVFNSTSVYSKALKSTTIPLLKKYGLSSTARLEKPARYIPDENPKYNYSRAFTAILDMFGDTILKIDDRPVLAQFTITGLSTTHISSWKNAYTLTHGGTEPFVMVWQTGTLLSDAWTAVLDGQFGWVDLDDSKNFLTYDEPLTPYRTYIKLDTAKANFKKMIERADEYIRNGKMAYYSPSVTPSFDDIAVWGWNTGPRKVEGGDNGELFDYKWQLALKGDYPMITIPTWDDWGEATAIEPTLSFGIDYLEKTRAYAAEFKDIEPNTVSLELPGWIYKIRKTSKDKDILAKMDEASDLIAQGKYDEAEAIVKPFVEVTGIPATSKEFFNYPTTPTTPLYTDPDETHTEKPDGTEIWTPSADTYVVISGNSVDKGGEDKLRVKSADATKLTRRAYIKFDTSNATNKNITSAKIRLYCTYAVSTPDEIAGRDINLYATSSDWNEGSFSWNSQPTVTEKIADVDASDYRSNNWVEIDITEYVKANIGKELSFSLWNEGKDTEQNHIEFRSRESKGYEPQLIIK